MYDLNVANGKGDGSDGLDNDASLKRVIRNDRRKDW